MHNTQVAVNESFGAWCVGQLALLGHVLFQTSGSSGKAKWVALSKSAMLASARAVNTHIGVKDGDSWGLALPIYHVGGFGVLVRSFLNGGRCAVFHRKWDPVAFSKFVYEEHCQHLSLVPTQLVDLVRARCVAPECVDSVVIGGGRLEDRIFEDAKALGWPVLRSYGMTEASSQIATGDNGDGYLRVLEGWSLRLSESGELEWKGKAGLSFYVVQDGSSTGWSIVDPKRSGWFRTQDRVLLRNGEVKVLGRSDHLVKILGELVDIQEIEELVEHHCRCACVIFAQEDQRRGVRLVPVLETDGVATLPPLAGLQRLEAPLYVQSFPRSGLGKIQREKLRAILNV
ncbi:AMP-binding protein [Rubritalea tangerina]|uniref:AMP-binding protein n=2 Tax=Rubritalea tangerina TaxID=430798 RepID=A0ABW4Z8F9_9BACT